MKTKPPQNSSSHVWGGGILFILILFVYFPALNAEFIWDDNDHLTENPHMEDVQGLIRIWTTPAAVYYPLVLTSFWIMRRIWDLNPFPYHLLNILLHFASAIVLWFILTKLKIKGGWFAAALFALHPVHVESVAWITELKDTQSGLFYLLSLLAFIHYYSPLQESFSCSRDISSHKMRWYIVSLFLFLLALLSKTSTVMMPVVLILILWWMNQSYSLKNIKLTLPYFALAILLSFWTILEQLRFAGAVGPEWSLGILDRTFIAARAIWFYLGKLIIPYPLIFIYPRWVLDRGIILWSIPLISLVLCFALLIWKRNGWGRAPLLAFLYFCASLFPVLGFFNMYFTRFSFVCDHFQYLASIGPLILFASGIARLVSLVKNKERILKGLVYGLILLILGVLSWKQTHIYKDKETLWRDTVKKNPKAWLAYNNLGEELARQGNMDEAFQCFTRAYELNNAYEAACYNLGTFALRQNDYEKAVFYFNRTINVRWNYPEAHNNLGNALTRAGRLEEAVKCYKDAITIDPKAADPYFNLGNTSFRQGRFNEAIEYYTKALEIKPSFADAQCNLGITLLETGRKKEAIAHLETALKINPNHAIAQQALTRALNR